VSRVIAWSTAPRKSGLCIEQLPFGLLLGGRLHEPVVGGAGVGVGAGVEPGAGVGVGVGAGPPRTGVGVGWGITTGIAIGDCEGVGFGSEGSVGSASLSA
jgi:hypothetical protein